MMLGIACICSLWKMIKMAQIDGGGIYGFFEEKRK